MTAPPLTDEGPKGHYSDVKELVYGHTSKGQNQDVNPGMYDSK